MKAILFAGGDVTDYEVLRPQLSGAEAVICADGGYRHAKILGLLPTLLIGDMDSIGDIPQNIPKKTYPARKDATDGELVIEYAIEQGFSELVLIGFCGGRSDHYLTNLMLLSRLKEQNAVMLDGATQIRPLKRKNFISGMPGDIISLIPIGGDLEGITTEGLDYPLSEETLFFASSRGNSNVMVSEQCTITVEKGIGLLIKSPAETEG